MPEDINYSLVEEHRPPLYTCMKYWGKKPHNIWRDFISNYTPDSGIFFDPFAGSAISSFESFKVGRKVIAFDLNPLTSFIIEVVASDYDSSRFKLAVNKIISDIENNETYQKLFRYNRNLQGYTLQNAKWNQGNIYEVCFVSDDGKSRLSLSPSEADYQAALYSKNIQINHPHPTRRLDSIKSISESFINSCGETFSDIYTDRNLWVLAELYNSITAIDDKNLKKQLLYGFIQIVHLSSKMCIPRSKMTNRDFSTSWGRPAYMVSKKSVEMNPLLLFKNSCLGKNSVNNALDFANSYFDGRKPKIVDASDGPCDLDQDFDILYGIIDAKTIDEYLPKNSVDFILTDPPYGGLIQYLDLSTIWLSWLELYNPKFTPNYDSEITINSIKTKDDFCADLTTVFKKVHEILKDDGHIVITFNSNNFDIWNSFLNSIEAASLHIESAVYQQNKRTGEANVSNRYGSSATDFYIKCSCSKNNDYEPILDDKQTNMAIIAAIETIIQDRNEPTPSQILLNCFYAEDAKHRYTKNLKSFNLSKFIEKNADGKFVFYDNPYNNAGTCVWISSSYFDEKSDATLTNRLTKYICSLFRKSDTINDKDLLEAVFKKFTGDLTPDINTIYRRTSLIADRKGDLWQKKI